MVRLKRHVPSEVRPFRIVFPSQDGSIKANRHDQEQGLCRKFPSQDGSIKANRHDQEQGLCRKFPSQDGSIKATWAGTATATNGAVSIPRWFD